MIIRIGVTGHRPDKLASDAQDVLRTAAGGVLVRIREALHRLDQAEPELIIASALAEGADRIVARAGLDKGCVLQVVLPFAPDVYEEDFASPQSHAEFRELLSRTRDRLVLVGARNDPASAYAAAGLAILDGCDLLIAVWNGRPGPMGGTADTVRQALAMRRPVLRFDEHGNGPVLLGAAGTSIDSCAEASVDAAVALFAERHQAPS